MSTTALTRIHFSRRRFVYSELFTDFSKWEELYFELKERLEKDSLFQLLSPELLIETDETSGYFRILIPVLGKPLPNFSYFDQEDGEFFEFRAEIGEYYDKKEALFNKAKAIKAALSQKVGSVYYIVLDGEKLSLHFFK